jgi:predicted XRE-type DNA-binding protein
MSDECTCELSSGNVFAALGHPDPEMAWAKAKLAHQIGAIVAQQGWTQVQAAQVLDIDQPKVSALVRGRLRDFSIERLMHFLTRLDRDVEITVAPRISSGRPARIAVHADEKQSATTPADPHGSVLVN